MYLYTNRIFLAENKKKKLGITVTYRRDQGVFPGNQVVSTWGFHFHGAQV